MAYKWSEFERIKSLKGFNKISLYYENVKSILTGDCYNNELLILNRVSKRIKIRLRTAKVTQLIKQTNKYLVRFNEIGLNDCLHQYLSCIIKENYVTSTGRIKLLFKDELESLLVVLNKTARVLHKTILYSFYTFSNCMPWLSLGHLAPHFLMLSSCLSRINIILKALLVYVSDLYLVLYQLKDKLKQRKILFQKNISSIPESVENYLRELNIKLSRKDSQLNTASIEVKATVSEPKREDIGVTISRVPETQKTFQKNRRKRNYEDIGVPISSSQETQLNSNRNKRKRKKFRKDKHNSQNFKIHQTSLMPRVNKITRFN